LAHCRGKIKAGAIYSRAMQASTMHTRERFGRGTLRILIRFDLHVPPRAPKVKTADKTSAIFPAKLGQANITPDVAQREAGAIADAALLE